MAHARQQIRDAIVAAVTGLSTAGGNVFDHRPWAVPEAKLPAIFVFGGDEAVSLGTQGDPATLDREFEIFADAVAAGEDCEDTVDTISAEMEAAIGIDPTLGGKVLHCRLAGSEINAETDAAMKAITRRNRFVALYCTAEDDAETITN